MKCPKCQFDIQEGARFYNECGHKLLLACGNCGKLNPLESKFCDECGEKLVDVEETEKGLAQPETERK